MKRRSFFRTIIGTCVAVSAAGRMVFQPELKAVVSPELGLANKKARTIYSMLLEADRNQKQNRELIARQMLSDELGPSFAFRIDSKAVDLISGLPPHNFD